MYYNKIAGATFDQNQEELVLKGQNEPCQCRCTKSPRRQNNVDGRTTGQSAQSQIKIWTLAKKQCGQSDLQIRFVKESDLNWIRLRV